MSLGLKIGVSLLSTPPGELTHVAARAEALGYESLWMPEHLAFSRKIKSRYPYSKDGVPPVGPDTTFLHSVTALAAAAAVTSHVQLGTSIYILPLRSPIVAAKEIASLDAISGGRVILGLGTGWMEEEFAAAGQEFSNRVSRLEEGIAAMQALWTQNESTFSGRYYRFTGLHMEPKPARSPHPPIVLGGETAAALRRAARLGDGWIGIMHTPDSAAERVKQLRRYRAEVNRDHLPFEVTVVADGSAGVDTFERFAEADVDRVIASWILRGDPIKNLEQLAERVLTR